LQWTRTDVDTLYMESRKRLQRIADDGLGADIERYAGADFIKEVHRAHAVLGRAIGATDAPAAEDEKEETSDLGDLIRKANNAISNYALQVVAWHNDGDDEVRTAARAALRPIDDVRAAQARRSGSG